MVTVKITAFVSVKCSDHKHNMTRIIKLDIQSEVYIRNYKDVTNSYAGPTAAAAAAASSSSLLFGRVLNARAFLFRF